jgi:NADH-quinone oxidoreductase subunit I
MSGYFKELFVGGKSLIVGLGVTLKAFFQPLVTTQYPREKIDITPNFRGHIDLVKDPETGTYRCISCGMCARECPSECITVKGEKIEGEKKKALAVFKLDFTKCSLCGICVETCPVQAIDFSNDYELAGFTREEFHFDLLQRLKERE